jgi:hypothetical protein
MRECLVYTAVAHMHTYQHCCCLIYLFTYVHTHQGISIVYMSSYICVHVCAVMTLCVLIHMRMYVMTPLNYSYGLCTHRFMVVGFRGRSTCVCFSAYAYFCTSSSSSFVHGALFSFLRLVLEFP